VDYNKTSLKQDLQIMAKYRLSAEELLVINLIFLVHEDHPEYFEQYNSECDHSDFKEIILSLQEKGVFTKKSISFPLNIRDLQFNKRFINAYLQLSNTLGIELLQAYPKTVNINGKLCSLTNISKFYNSMEEFTFAYGKAIKFNQQNHEKVLEILQWAVEQDLIHYNLCEFIISQKWVELEQLRQNNNAPIFNTFEDL
jgi:hypothetical protein